MMTMQVGLAATACLNCSIIFSGAHCENCSFSLSTPSALAAAAAPVGRARTGPAPELPPICREMVTPVPGAASAGSVSTRSPTITIAYPRCKSASGL